MAGAQILVVEDNEKNMKLFRDVLTRPATARSRRQPADRRSSWPPSTSPDLVLMDIQLPDIDGVEALGRLRADAADRFDPRASRSPRRQWTEIASASSRPASTAISPSP